ncbi:glycogen synthase GlgA [Elioraea thermophila]|uniref:glycogen synthase GlgA n=1 Tax=Elioraea thermophila TaxID=2185104 RepID=UPI000DF48961|nr:glycogen synthase GlgA [Elioraea thermophila]
MTLSVLAVASEVYPLVKTGGLADVVGALPAALAPFDVTVTTLVPGYPTVCDALEEAAEIAAWHDLPGGPARGMRGRAAGLDLVVLDAPQLFDRPGNPYLGPDGADWPDNGLRFAALGAAAARLAHLLGVDAVHAHDWQAGLAPAYLRHGHGRAIPSLFTVHNLAFQGRFGADLFPLLGLPPSAFAIDGVEFHGGVGFLKAGLWYADALSTVSPTYAEEILTPEGGMGLDGLLRGRAEALFGIRNGLDVEQWNPATDPHLAARFSADDPSPRAANAALLRERFALDANLAGPLFAFIGRLTWQKGIDLLLEALPALLDTGAALVILGQGEAALAAACEAAQAAHPGRVGTFVGYSEPLARLVYGGADAVLIPSRFEPCGLVQLIAQRYGALPVVARTGGLADTVIDANDAALSMGCGTGVMFSPPSAAALAAAIRRTSRLFQDQNVWRVLQANAMRLDVSWRGSAERYAALFRRLAGR